MKSYLLKDVMATQADVDYAIERGDYEPKVKIVSARLPNVVEVTIT